MRPTHVLAVLLSLLVLPATAEDERRILKVGEVSGDALGPGEATALRGMISSYVIERGGFTVIDSEGRQLSVGNAEAAGEAGARKPAPASLSADYVLGAWTEDEAATLPTVVDQACDAVESVLRDGLVNAMNVFNGRGKDPAPTARVSAS